MTAVSEDELKRSAAVAAAEYVRSGMVLGLGTGSTVAHLLDHLGAALRAGTLKDIVAVPTSNRTEARARELGIDLIGLGDRPRIDLTIDGADEISPELDVIKGGGGALLREKMVAQSSQRVVIIADASKAVERLGTTFPLPIEIVPWGWRSQLRFLEDLGADVAVRTGPDGAPVESDNGQMLLDCRFPGGIDDAEALERALAARAGIVESGLFLGLADEVILGSDDGVRRLRRPS